MSESFHEDKLAAGGVVIDSDRVLLIHRPKYDDWSFPKGGVNPGETIREAALREVREETGLRCRILGELSTIRYHYRTRKGNIRPKVVHYFLMEVADGELQTPGDEVDRAEWFELKDADRKLSYHGDKQMLRLIDTR